MGEEEEGEEERREGEGEEEKEKEKEEEEARRRIIDGDGLWREKVAAMRCGGVAIGQQQGQGWARVIGCDGRVSREVHGRETRTASIAERYCKNRANKTGSAYLELCSKPIRIICSSLQAKAGSLCSPASLRPASANSYGRAHSPRPDRRPHRHACFPVHRRRLPAHRAGPLAQPLVRSLVSQDQRVRRHPCHQCRQPARRR